ncbi:MAG: hypothetical protein NZL98_01270, partial [Anaerolineales bacterium]|nr:hypothetical protein [Anaerolineales bacterium]MDW8226906.1 hypothetical protein [Anaerolineales bacterium]
LPHLTIGGLLLAQRRARARVRLGAEAAALASLSARLEAISFKWRSAWEGKCRREVHARLVLWRSFLQEYHESPSSQAENYPQQVQWRVLLHLLTEPPNSFPKEAALVLELDDFLRSAFLPGRFLWESDLIAAFPEETFWFLYGTLKS